MDTPNKSASFCSNILGDTTLQNLKSEKTRKISLLPILRHENLADLFRYSLANPKCHEKGFICIQSLNFPKMRVEGPF